MTQPPNPGQPPQGEPGGYQPQAPGGYQPPQPGGYQPPQPGGYPPPPGQPGPGQPAPGQPGPGQPAPGQPAPRQPGPGQPGGYQPPQEGHPGAYQQPSPYGQAGYGQPEQPQDFGAAGMPPAGGPVSVGDGFTWAWNKFTKNAGPLVLATLAIIVVIGVLGAIFGLISSALSKTTETSTYYGTTMTMTTVEYGPGSIIVSIIGAIVIMVVSGALISGFLGGIFDIADGKQVGVGSFFKPRNLANVILASVLVGIVVGIGLVLCIIPGIIAALFLWFTIVAVIGQGSSAVDGMKTSVSLVKENLGTSILAALLAYVITLVGVAVCYVGLLVAYPLAALLQVYMFRRLSGQPVAPLTTS